MSSDPKQFRELITRDIFGLLLIGSLLLLVFASSQESLIKLVKQFESRQVETSQGEGQLADRDAFQNLADVNEHSPGKDWKGLSDPAIPFSLNVPANTQSVAPAGSIELGESPLQWVAYRGTGVWSRGDLELGEVEMTVQWGRVDSPLSQDEQRRFLRQEPSRLLLNQGLQPRVGLSSGQTWREGSSYGFLITAELNDGRKVVTRYDLTSNGILQVQSVFREKPQQPWPVDELIGSLQIRPEKTI